MIRKLFATILAAALCLAQADAAVSFTTVGGTAVASGTTNNFVGAITAGAPFFVVAAEHANQNFNTPTDSSGDTFVLIGTQFLFGSTGGRVGLWWVASPVGGGSVTVTITESSTTSQCMIGFQETGAVSFTGDSNSPGTATSGTQSSGSIGASANTGFALATQPSTLISYLVLDGGFTAGTHPTEDTSDNWVHITDVTISGGNSCSAAYQNVVATTAVPYQNAVWSSASVKWGVNEFGFNSSAAAGPADAGDLGPLTGVTQYP